MSLHLAEQEPVIAEAISAREALLQYSLPGLFNLRRELARQYRISPTPELHVELGTTDNALADMVGFLGLGGGYDTLAHQLQIKGVARRGEVYRALATYYDRVDAPSTAETTTTFPLLGVIGDVASGKGTVGKILAEEYGLKVFPLSDRLREVATSTGNPPPHDRGTLRAINDHLLDRFGEEVLMRWTLDATKTTHDYYRSLGSQDAFAGAVLDGTRSLEAARYFKTQPGRLLIGIQASPDTRFRYALQRNRGGDDLTRETFDKTDVIEAPRVAPIYPLCDIIIPNEGTYEEFVGNIRTVARHIGLRRSAKQRLAT